MTASTDSVVCHDIVGLDQTLVPLLFQLCSMWSLQLGKFGDINHSSIGSCNCSHELQSGTFSVAVVVVS
eukprot:4741110-Amphidinium_carterae.1